MRIGAPQRLPYNPFMHHHLVSVSRRSHCPHARDKWTEQHSQEEETNYWCSNPYATRQSSTLYEYTAPTFCECKHNTTQLTFLLQSCTCFYASNIYICKLHLKVEQGIPNLNGSAQTLRALHLMRIEQQIQA